MCVFISLFVWLFDFLIDDAVERCSLIHVQVHCIELVPAHQSLDQDQ